MKDKKKKKKVDPTQENKMLHEKSQQKQRQKADPRPQLLKWILKCQQCCDVSVFPKGASARGLAPGMVVLR